MQASTSPRQAGFHQEKGKRLRAKGGGLSAPYRGGGRDWHRARSNGKVPEYLGWFQQPIVEKSQF
ncbi:hypothetical protein RMHFA_04272 [Roseomonas mucosa]|nr:hypothetical protein HVIM_04272 [Roseomonas mucosa]QDE00524.1 hypothetical protein ADP8_04272 [Roseomonas mucosa]UZO92820.1 hypothetical protein RMP42_04272 [Roseomonas mucosa]UZO97259.1 hypothetical protein RMHFA_04272 [Roseomonas mucosa]